MSRPLRRDAASRREFLRTTAASAALTIAAPMVLADDKVAPKHAIVGDGAHKYECHHDWLVPPQKHAFGGASHGIALDSAGRIYITHLGGPGSIFVYDAAGKFVASLLPQYQGAGHGIEIRKDGGAEFLYLAYNKPKPYIVKANLKGDVVWEKSYPKESRRYDEKNPNWNPTNISFLPDGGFHVGDGYGSNFLHRYDKDGNYVSTFGAGGTARGQMRTPHGHALDTRGDTPRIVVADRGNARLQIFSIDGDSLGVVEEAGPDHKSRSPVLFPADVDFQGELMLVPDLHCRVSLFDKNNKVIAHLGDDADWRKEALAGFKMRSMREKWRPGRFIHPHDAKFLGNGDIVVAEWVHSGRVTLLKRI